MSYGSQTSAPTRRKGNNLIFLIVIFAIAYFVLSGRNGAPQPGQGTQQQGDSVEEILGTKPPRQLPADETVIGGGGDFEGRAMPQSGQPSSSDWAIGDAGVSSRSNKPKTSDQDWSINTDLHKTQGTSSDKEFKLSNEPRKTSPVESGGDWSIKDPLKRSEN